MTEYIDIQPETTADPAVMCLITNLDLTGDGPKEVYQSPEEGELGSALAQALFEVPGLSTLTLDGPELYIQKDPDVEWHDLIEDISDAIRDFFL